MSSTTWVALSGRMQTDKSRFDDQSIMEEKESQIIVTKASGEKAAFSSHKLKRSLSRAGADDVLINRVLNKLVPQLYNGIPTKKIYGLAFKILRKDSKPQAARYKLKQAILELGPSGYPFEKFVAEILKSKGFEVEVGVTVEGHCVNHEIDVIAKKGSEQFMVECKFHNEPGIKCDVKVPLYIQARFQDVEKKWSALPGFQAKTHQGWLVTNTKFSVDAIQYGTCAGLHLLGWDYPAVGSLNELIDESGLHPITCLGSLTRVEKEKLLGQKIVLTKELLDRPHLLDSLGIPGVRKERIFKESRELIFQPIHVVSE